MSIGGEVTAPIVVKRVEPKWPGAITRQRTWLYSLVVTKDGRATDVELLRGDRDTYSQFNEEAIRRWEFKPGTYHGKPVAVRYNLSVTIHVR